MKEQPSLEEYVSGYWSILMKRGYGANGSTMASYSWRAIRFVGTYDGRTVDDPIAHNDPAWVRRLHALLIDGELPKTVVPCVPQPARGSTVWSRAIYVLPSQIDWTGYKHAGGQPARPVRSGSRQPESRTIELGSPVVVSARYPQELLAEIDAARGEQPRQQWLVEAARERLAKDGAP
jgi:hypothetical protein